VLLHLQNASKVLWETLDSFLEYNQTPWRLTVFVMKAFLHHLQIPSLKTDLDDAKFLMNIQTRDMGKQQILRVKKLNL
jgi:hypothetical protein